MSEQQSPSSQGWTPGFGQDQFPGIEDSFSGPPAVINPTVLPAQTASATASKSILPFNITNLGDIKAIVDRMGGVDGILTTVGKFQKFMSTIQQMAPMLKLFMGNKGKSATANKSAPKRRRPSSKPTGNKSRTGRSAKRR